MNNYLRSSVAALGFGLLTAGVFAPTVVLAQPISAPRQFTTQQMHYIRATLTYQMCTPVTTTCTVKIPASVPYNAIITRITAAVGTAFNSTTSDVIFVGTTQALSNQLVGAGCNIHAAGLIACTISAGGASGINAIGNGATQTGLNGGFDLFVQWVAGTGNTATAGYAALIIEFIAPNDGACTATPLGATASGC